jgi:glycosyltransferase involved in cell wall biosynthesis
LSVVVIVPGRFETRTGGYVYDRRIAGGLRDRGWSVDVREISDSFPNPTPAALVDAGRVLGTIPDGATVLIDGLAMGAMPVEVDREASRLRIVALVHHPLAAETGIEPGDAARLEKSERRALAAARVVVVTSRATASALARYGVNADRIRVVEPGTDPAPLAAGSGDAASQLLCVASLIPRKGHETLFRALASIRDRGWRLTCVGSVERDPPTVTRLRAQLRADGLDDRVTLAGETDAATVSAYYDRADLFVLPTEYEGYGMVVAEALAHGLPVISTATGGIPDLVGDDAGLLVPPGDADRLAAAIARVLADPLVRARFARGARRVRDRLAGWEVRSGQMAEVLERVAADGRLQR